MVIKLVNLRGSQGRVVDISLGSLRVEGVAIRGIEIGFLPEALGQVGVAKEEHRNYIGRKPEAPCSSTPSKPDCRAQRVACAYSSITPGISLSSSALGVSYSVMALADITWPLGFTAEGATGSAPSGRRDECA